VERRRASFGWGEAPLQPKIGREAADFLLSGRAARTVIASSRGIALHHGSARFSA
jgi:hypothetical protein